MDNELEEFINENHHSWFKGFDSGIALNWDFVANALDEDKWAKKIIGNFSRKKPKLNWNNPMYL